MYSIDYNSYRSVKSFNRRVRFLIFHYTAQNFADSINSLTGDAVSAHYLLPDPKDKTYCAAGFKDLRIFNLVDEQERAWHAGVSSWAGRTNLNDSSIGIEIVNLATETNGLFTFPSFKEEQVKALIELSHNILQRYPDITATQVIGHSDIAPGRKSDPGAAFPWKRLYQAGIGAWYDTSLKCAYMRQFILRGMPAKSQLLAKFKRYGYDISNANSLEGFKQLVRAFQLHFRPQSYNGKMDIETAAILYALVDKYFPQN